MSFYDSYIKTAPLFGSPSRVDDMSYLEPTTRQAILNVIEDAATQNIKLMVFETYRSSQRQELLFEQGATQLKEVGVHHYGLAADVVKNIGGEPSWKGDFTFLVYLAKKHGLISGIDWGEPGRKHGFVDACHLQRVCIRDQPRLFEATWYPPTDYDPYKIVSV